MNGLVLIERSHTRLLARLRQIRPHMSFPGSTAGVDWREEFARGRKGSFPENVPADVTAPARSAAVVEAAVSAEGCPDPAQTMEIVHKTKQICLIISASPARGFRVLPPIFTRGSQLKRQRPVVGSNYGAAFAVFTADAGGPHFAKTAPRISRLRSAREDGGHLACTAGEAPSVFDSRRHGRLHRRCQRALGF
jgi:hypothetical protein